MMANGSENLSERMSIKADHDKIDEIVEVCYFTTEISRIVGVTSLALGAAAITVSPFTTSVFEYSAFVCAAFGFTLKMGADIGDEIIGKKNINRRLREMYKNLLDWGHGKATDPAEDYKINDPSGAIVMEKIENEFEKIHQLAGLKSRDNWEILFKIFSERHSFIILYIILLKLSLSLISSFNGADMTNQNAAEVQIPEMNLNLAMTLGVIIGIGILIFMIDLSSLTLRHEKMQQLMKMQKNVLQHVEGISCKGGI